MSRRVSRMKDRFLNGNDLISTFLRSTVVAQLASWVDMGTGFVLFAFAHLAPWLSTAVGAFAGGVLNCTVNYKFTFHAGAVAKRAVVVKYALVWIGSMLLNVYGTQLLYELLDRVHLLELLGFKPNGYYAAARLTVSLVVSLFWNFLMQKNFVYRVTRFDPYAVSFVNLFLHPKRRKNG